MSDNSRLNLDTKVAAKYLFESIIDKENISPYTIIFPRTDIGKEPLKNGPEEIPLMRH